MTQIVIDTRYKGKSLTTFVPSKTFFVKHFKNVMKTSMFLNLCFYNIIKMFDKNVSLHAIVILIGGINERIQRNISLSMHLLFLIPCPGCCGVQANVIQIIFMQEQASK